MGWYKPSSRNTLVYLQWRWEGGTAEQLNGGGPEGQAWECDWDGAWGHPGQCQGVRAMTSLDMSLFVMILMDLSWPNHGHAKSSYNLMTSLYLSWPLSTFHDLSSPVMNCLDLSWMICYKWPVLNDLSLPLMACHDLPNHLMTAWPLFSCDDLSSSVINCLDLW